MMKILIALICLLTLETFGNTRLGLNNNIRQNYISPRALGMGNAFTAVADDHNVLYYNPAGLAFLQEGNLNLKLQASGTPGMLNFYNDMKGALDKPEAEKPVAMESVFSRNFGSDFNFRPVVGSTWVRPGWGIGFIPIDLSIDLSIHQNLGPTLSVEAYQDSTLAFGYAKKVQEDLGVGVTAKAVYRGYVGKALPAAEFVVNPEYFSKKDADEGLTFDFDLGSLYEIKFQSGDVEKLHLSTVVRNVLDYGFKTNLHMIDSDSQEPPKLGRVLDLGSRVQMKKFWNLVPNFVFDVRDIGHQHWNWMKGVHFGAEMLWDVSWWLSGGYRVGINQGYFTAGTSFKFVWFKLDLATWGEEMGTTNAKKENRRWILAASMDF